MKKFLLISLLILSDRITKISFKDKHINLLFFSIDYIENKGIIFGLLKGNRPLLIILSFLLLFILIYYFNKKKDMRFALSFVFAGLIGNLIDRIFFGYVIDFINIRVWPVFNLADSFTVFGITLFLLKRKNI